MSAEPNPKSAIVVGSGIVGIACAHYLSAAGLKTSVIDRKTIAGACSHGNCGYVCPSHVLPLTEPGAIQLGLKSLFDPHAAFRIKPALDPALWAWMLQFARRCTRRQMLAAGRHLQAILESSMAEYRQLMETEQINCEWREDGLLYVFRTQSALDEFAKTDQFVADHFGIAAEHVPGNALSQFDPALRDDLAGAFHHTHDASLRPDLLALQWSDCLKDRGVEFVEFCELQQVKKSGGRVTQLVTSSGPMEADVVVFAMGAWSGKFEEQLGCRIPVQPGKGYSLTMTRPDPCPRYPMLFPEKRVAVSPFSEGYRLGSMMEFAGFDESIPTYRIEQLRNSAEPYLLAPYTDEVQEEWFGWRPMTYDTVPIVGLVPGLSNALLATGHSMLGVSLATGTGRLVRELALGESPHIDPTGYSPSRFQ